VTEAALYYLEVVQVHEEHRDQIALPACSGKGVLEAF
jgi:hypothetical protein